MNYPTWAPMSLVDLLRKRRDSSNSRFDLDIDSEICRLSEKYSLELDDEKTDRLRLQMRRAEFFLPHEEGNRLIERLISNPAMKSVWESLERRKTSDRYAIDLYTNCDSIIFAWRKSPKYSPTKRIELLLNIIRAAGELRELLDESEDHDFYRDLDAISDDKIEWLLDVLDSTCTFNTKKEHIDYARFSLHEIVPSIRLALVNLEIKTSDFLKVEPIVRKPQSKNAELHYFARSLSSYFRTVYKQPLHENVATIASVALERDDVDSDIVRKLVSEKL